MSKNGKHGAFQKSYLIPNIVYYIFSEKVFEICNQEELVVNVAYIGEGDALIHPAGARTIDNMVGCDCAAHSSLCHVGHISD